MNIDEYMQRVAQAKAKIGRTLRTDIKVERETEKSHRLREIEARQRVEAQRALEEKAWQ